MASILEIFKTCAEEHRWSTKPAATLLRAPERALHVSIDFQRFFCDPDPASENMGTIDTDRAAETAAWAAPEFNRRGIKNLWVYLQQKDKKNAAEAHGGFYKVPALTAARANNLVVAKTDNDAFINSPLRDTLKFHDAQTLLFSGVNFSVCVAKTVLSATRSKQNFKVGVLLNATANCCLTDNEALAEQQIIDMYENGVIFTDTTEIFKPTGIAFGLRDRRPAAYRQPN